MLKKEANPDYLCFVPEDELRGRLTPLQFAVAATGATERPFANAYWDNHVPGLYLDVVDGTPLFASSSKYDSGTGWPSFWAPLDEGRILLEEDLSLGMRRTEIRSRSSGSHLSHVFDDGPEPTGLRYCVNSASLRFVPAAELEREGLGEYAALFK